MRSVRGKLPFEARSGRGIATILLLALLGGIALAQQNGRLPKAPATPFCASDEAMQRNLANNPSLSSILDAQDSAIWARSRMPSPMSGPPSYLVPTVVYIVHQGGAENISDAQVQAQLVVLNNHFSAYGIKFCLATKNGSSPFPGPTPGIFRISSPLTYHNMSTDEAALKGLSSLPGDKYCRIFVVKDINSGSGVAGYAQFPGTVPTALDGIVMRYDFFGDSSYLTIPNYNQGKILAHEAGHYFNLYHTFQGGCAGMSTADCATAGDRVCDTPPVAVANTGCPSSVDSCAEVPNLPDLLNNHMDYTDDTCRTLFTSGQGTRMSSAITLFRSLLVSPANLINAGVLCAGGLNPTFSPDNYNPCVSNVVTFTAASNPGATNGWDFGDSTTAIGSPVTHLYATSGIYTVTLTVSNSTNSISSSQQIFVSACAPILSSQGNWYFGNRAGLNFSTGVPVPDFSALNSNTVSQLEGVVSQSSPSGNLLFYSDGVRVWNKFHQLINPAAPLRGHPSSSQSALTFPVPGNTNRYYLFTTPSYVFSTPTNLAYSIVDVTGGLATLALTNAPIPLPAGATSVAESAIAIQRCNGDYWVILRGYLGDPSPQRDSFYVYSVTSSGVTLAATYPLAVPSHVGYHKISPDGTMLACSGGYAVICDFDRNTGVISNRRALPRGNYGITFSPNSKLFYIADFDYAVLPYYQTIYQYDLTSATPAATEKIIGTTADLESVLQIGPDKKVYMSLINQQHLAVINFPDVLVTPSNPNACGYNYNGPSLITSTQAITSQLGLPNMIDALPVAQVPLNFTYTISNCTTVAFHGPVCASSFLWNFGDSTTSTLASPTHTYSAPGAYNVVLTVNGTNVVAKTISMGFTASLAGPTAICIGLDPLPYYSYSVSASLTGLQYAWTASGGDISSLTNQDNVTVVWTNTPATLAVTVTDPVTGCSKLLSMVVSNGNCCVPPPPNMELWLPFDEIAGPTAANLVPGGSSGTHFNSPTVMSGYVARSLAFDGVDDYVQVPSYAGINFGTNDFSIDAWVRRPAGNISAGIKIIVDKRVEGVTTNGYAFFLNGTSGLLGFQLADGVFANYASTLGVPSDFRWHHVAVTVQRANTNGLLFYLDGAVDSVPQNPTARPGSVSTAQALRVGARCSAVTNIFLGNIDEVELFSRAITGAEVQQLWKAGSSGKCKPPTFSDCPSSGITFDCLAYVPSPPMLTATSTCPGSVSVYYNETQSAPGSSCSNFITRTWTAVDTCGQSNTCVQTFLVQDTSGPILTCPPNMTVGGCTNAQVCFFAETFDKCPGTVTVTFNPPSCSYFPMGTTPVTCTAVDSCGNSNTCTFTVTVIGDTNPPVITLCPPKLLVCITNNECGVMPDFTTMVQATDDSGTVHVSQSVPVGAVICGPTPMTFYVTDNCSNLVTCQTVVVPEICCYRPPESMVLWLTFDESAGITCLNSVGGNNGIRYEGGTIATAANGPVRTAGQYVGSCLRFDGANDQVRVTDYATINFGTNDFSMDAWVKWDGRPGTRIMVDKRKASPVTGYSWYLSGGIPALQLADGTAGNFAAASAIPSNVWTHLAVTVRRSATNGLRFYRDGVLTDSLNPTSRSGSLTTTSNLIVGASLVAGNAPFPGMLDEIELFRRALSASEIMGLYQAKAKGKCRPSCSLPYVTTICSNSVTLTTLVCNDGATTMDCVVSFNPINPPACGDTSWPPLPGSPPPPYFVYTPTNLHILPHQCLPVTVTITRPPGLYSSIFAAPKNACYTMDLFVPATSEHFSCLGTVQNSKFGCPQIVIGPGNWTNLTFATNIVVHGLGTNVVSLKITNPTNAPVTLHPQFVVLDQNQQPDLRVLSLNGLPPGEPVLGQLTLPPDGSADLPVAFSYTDAQPRSPYQLVLLLDIGEGGALVPVASVTISYAELPTEGPLLNVVAGKGGAAITWDLVNSDFLLESIGGLGGTNWSPTGPAVEMPEATQGITVPATNVQQLFRLRLKP